MSEFDSAANEPLIDRPERSGSLWLLIVLALVLFGIAAILAVMDRTQAQPFVLAMLRILAVVAVFCLFAWAMGFLRLSGRSAESSPIAAAFLASLEDGAIVTDQDGRLVYANQAYADLTGVDSSADVRVIERVFSSDPDAADAIYRLSQAMRDGRRAQEEVRMASPLGRSEGGPRWYRVLVRPLEITAKGTRSSRRLTVWQLSDITRDRAEQENSFQELQRVINFLDHAPAGFLSCDAAGQVVYLNATLADWLGYDLAQFEVGDLSLIDIVRGDGAELIRSVTGQAGEVKSDTFDLDLVTRSGRGLPVRLLHRVPFGENGIAGDSRTLVLNRSRGEEASEALRAAEVRFARFFNNTPIAIASLDKEGRVLRTNAPFLKLFGAVNSDDGAPKMEAYVAQSGRDDLGKALKAASQGIGEIAPIDIPLSEGHDPRSATFYVSAVQDGEGDGETTIVYALETTQQRTLEAQFAQSQKMQAIGQLAGGVAHDFNNVLTAIIGFSDLLLASHRPTDPSFQDIMNIKQNANRAAGLVRQLLAFSRRQTLRPQQLALNDVLADLSILLDRLLGEKVELHGPSASRCHLRG